jgi:hypothetical protein
VIARRLTPLILVVAALVGVAAAAPFLLTDGHGPSTHVSVRGAEVVLHGVGPYRHMPADVAVQGLAQDAVTLAIGLPALLAALLAARRGSAVGHLALCGAVAYLFVQYVLYLAMATYNVLFLLWVAIVGSSAQALVRLLLAVPAARFVPTPDRPAARRFVGVFLLVNGALVASLWLSMVVPPLLDGTLYPPALAHLTTLVVQGFDLALFLPPSLLAGAALLRREALGALLGPIYAVFLSLQMTALLAKIGWMAAIGVDAGPALVVIPALLVGACAAAVVALRPLAGRRLAPDGAG